ncbi:hypothetical protein [Nostoc sp.]|uniref:hypothetical protein n=1 Tax=Nostoc sp. TaxID=1180 RepID=UPI00359402CA
MIFQRQHLDPFSSKFRVRSLGEIIDFGAKAVVMIVGLPIRVAAAIALYTCTFC